MTLVDVSQRMKDAWLVFTFACYHMGYVAHIGDVIIHMWGMACVHAVSIMLCRKTGHSSNVTLS